MTEAIDARLAAVVSRLCDDLLRAAGPVFVGVYLHGSAVLGDFVPGASDLDVLIVAHDDVERSTLSAIASALTACVPSPAVSIEASVVTRSAAMAPHEPWPFLVHVTNHPSDNKVVYGTDIDGDPDLVLHYAVLRQHSWTAVGAPPVAAIGEIDRATVIAQLADELRWAAAHGHESYAVLNACRALRFVHDGVLCSKTDGGAWAATQGIEPELVGAALAARHSARTWTGPSESGTWVLSIAESLGRDEP